MTAENTQSAAQTDSPNLTVSDLVIMHSILQATASRGAIRAEEMFVVGTLHDKLKKYLEANGALQPATATAPAQAQQGN